MRMSVLASGVLAIPAILVQANVIPNSNHLDLDSRALEKRAHFANSCIRYGLNSVSKSLFVADCPARDGSMKFTQMMLEKCLWNNCGQLMGGPNGNYQNSCDVGSCRMIGPSMACNCKDCGGNWVATMVNLTFEPPPDKPLDDVLTNEDGWLDCFGFKFWRQDT